MCTKLEENEKSIISIRNCMAHVKLLSLLCAALGYLEAAAYTYRRIHNFHFQGWISCWLVGNVAYTYIVLYLFFLFELMKNEWETKQKALWLMKFCLFFRKCESNACTLFKPGMFCCWSNFIQNYFVKKSLSVFLDIFSGYFNKLPPLTFQIWIPKYIHRKYCQKSNKLLNSNIYDKRSTHPYSDMMEFKYTFRILKFSFLIFLLKLWTTHMISKYEKILASSKIQHAYTNWIHVSERFYGVFKGHSKSY